MKEDAIISIDYTQTGELIKPCHKLVKHFAFREGEEAEAKMTHFLAEVAEKNGLSGNDIYHMLPLILRMLKSKSDWAN